MTTVVVAKKAGQVVMGCDSLVTFGDTRLSERFESNEKIFTVHAAGGPTLVGTAGTVAHFPVLRKGLQALDKSELRLHGRDEIYDTFLKLHSLLKEKFFLQTKEDDNDPYESMQFSLLLANSSGIYGVYSYREVFEFKEFWGIGSGRSFALGAMHAVFEQSGTAEQIARAGLLAGCELDKNSSGPLQVHSLPLTTTPIKAAVRKRPAPQSAVAKKKRSR